MIEQLADMNGQLSELAAVLSKFNSEAAQLRLLGLGLGKQVLQPDYLPETN